MAKTSFTVTFDKKTLALIAKAPVVALNRLAEEAEFEAKKRSPFLTGTNRRSIQTRVVDADTRAIETTSGYGGYLELGTSKMPARPYMRPAIVDVGRRAASILKGVVPKGNL